jgi:hypothetical protein
LSSRAPSAPTGLAGPRTGFLPRSPTTLRPLAPFAAVRAANAIIQAVEAPNPPLHLLLGKDALRMAREKLDALHRDFDTWQNVTVGADFPAGEPTKVV